MQIAVPELAAKIWGMTGATQTDFMLFKSMGWYLAMAAAAALSLFQVHLSLSLSLSLSQHLSFYPGSPPCAPRAFLTLHSSVTWLCYLWF